MENLSQNTGLKYSEQKRRCPFAWEATVMGKKMLACYASIRYFWSDAKHVTFSPLKRLSFPLLDSHDPLQWNSHLELLFYDINLFVQPSTHSDLQSEQKKLSNLYFLYSLSLGMVRHTQQACLNPLTFTVEFNSPIILQTSVKSDFKTGYKDCEALQM